LILTRTSEIPSQTVASTPKSRLWIYSFSDRDERHKFNLFSYFELPGGFNLDARLQAHSPQLNGPCCNRNAGWKNNEYISFDWRAMRPFKVGEHYRLIPAVEVFTLSNNKNNVNPLSTPALFNFDGFFASGGRSAPGTAVRCASSSNEAAASHKGNSTEEGRFGVPLCFSGLCGNT